MTSDLGQGVAGRNARLTEVRLKVMTSSHIFKKVKTFHFKVAFCKAMFKSMCVDPFLVQYELKCTFFWIYHKEIQLCMKNAELFYIADQVEIMAPVHG